MNVSSDVSAATTDGVLVAAPGAGEQIVVTDIYVSTDTAQTISLESGNSTLKWRQYCAANGGSVFSGTGEIFRCADNATLTWTTSATGNAFVSIDYSIVATGVSIG